MELSQLPYSPSLSRPIEAPHVTFAFREPFPAELLGRPADILATGYANDGDNEAVSVELPNWTLPYYAGAPQPHVTISVSEYGKPKDSGSLPFEQTSPAWISGTFGYFGFDQQVHIS